MDEQDPPPEHEHVWKPLEGYPGVYECECGSHGYRHRRGHIQPYKGKRKVPALNRGVVGKSNILGGHRAGKRGPGSY